MKTLLLVLAVTLSFNVCAQSVGPQDVEPMLQQMQASGQISAREVEITREYMKSMDSAKWAEIQKKAEDCINRNPAATTQKAEKGEQIDLKACD